MQASAATPPADAPAISPALEAEGGVMLVVPINDVPVVVGGLVASLAGGWGSLTAIGPMLQDRNLSVND